MQLRDVRDNYDRAAPHYDRWVDLAARLLRADRWRRRTVELLGDLSGARVLDIGCGTGSSFPLLLPRVGPAGRVVGLDYSEGMLSEASKRAARHGWDNVELLQGDAAALEGVPEPVDAVISAWCMGIVHDLVAALHRAVDVLRPGGRIAIMDFRRARPDHGALRWLCPVYSAGLRWTGIDEPEDLDDAALQSKWTEGIGVLRERLEDLSEERYLQGAGVILAGRKPPAGGER